MGSEQKFSKLVVCKCRKHARIVFANGYTSSEFTFKQHGYELIYGGVKVMGISLIDSGRLRDQIRACPLPEEHLSVDGHLLWASEVWNLYIHRDDPLKPKITFHAMLKKVCKRSLPKSFLKDVDERFGIGYHRQNPRFKHVN